VPSVRTKTRPTPGVPAPSDELEPSQHTSSDQLAMEDSADEDEDQLKDTENQEQNVIVSLQPSASSSLTKKKKYGVDLQNKVLEKSMLVLEDISNKRRSTADEEDGDVIFGKHVCQSLKEIKNMRSKEVAKLRIQQLLFDAQFNSASANNEE
jgi:hypothetical protein